MTIKAIAMDMDGTLLNEEKRITEKTKAALVEAQKQGIKVILASGRPTPGLFKYAEELAMEKYDGVGLSFNGAHVLDYQTNEVLFEQPLPLETSKAILEHLKAFDVKPMICHQNYMYVNDVFDNTIHLPDGDMNIIEYEARAGGYKLCEVNDLAGFCDFSLYKILVAADPDYLNQHYKEMMRPFEGQVSALFSAPFYFEFTDAGITKAKAIAATLPRLNLKKEELMAFGDGQNDQAMIEYAGVGVAMDNATTDLKQIADEITLSNNEDGIAHTLEKYLS
ncbi:Cof-type HAD-IIB family hydrolase [Tetragenococcus koreensis]|uniref:Phosphatase n=1 Tax=Tetragenococcus koreensis TaxID=290335 RepID=A0AAN4UCY0_9ENTE|nr:Cof-type HAD-IIB family hydrolase [Tetragenococcus koreensis]MDN6567973.1 Cof-type HAD-IIB family hydrolase [Tetragenococcus halophilus]MDN6590914.1 Cof-type HAD-IIB family hydrolase [Lactobacillus sp.]MCF1585941.1 Cof-type HAD-IIB family hydrolase [Tetragenococcus koreensis]MCF1615518.1 Cof-type HAD-IIB family hydrolase [Tetragenococcus koreensis]MCF1617563.1 Cof-type HAD-IIB family hydrolase [Tetragenococcus koreensis]